MRIFSPLQKLLQDYCLDNICQYYFWLSYSTESDYLCYLILYMYTSLYVCICQFCVCVHLPIGFIVSLCVCVWCVHVYWVSVFVSFCVTFCVCFLCVSLNVCLYDFVFVCHTIPILPLFKIKFRHIMIFKWIALPLLLLKFDINIDCHCSDWHLSNI